MASAIKTLGYLKYRARYWTTQPGKVLRLASRPLVNTYNKHINPFRFSAIADIDEVIFVNLRDIVYIWGDKKQRSLFPPGSIIGSYADLEAFSSHCKRDPKNRSVQTHFAEGVPWLETDLFVFYRNEFERGRRGIRGCHNLADLHDRYKGYDRVYREIERNGIDYERYDRGISPLYVHISMHGEFIWTSNGQHRLAMCMALGLEKIPCRVYLRHRQWQQQREVVKVDLAAGRTVDPALLDHPDMQDIVRSHENRSVRARLAPAGAGSPRAVGREEVDETSTAEVWRPQPTASRPGDIDGALAAGDGFRDARASDWPARVIPSPRRHLPLK